MEKFEARKARNSRETGETSIELELDLDGAGKSDVDTGVGFLDHMLNLFSWHSGIDLVIKAKGDLEVDPHHTIEDVGIVLGRSIAEAAGDKKGIQRYGDCMLPMDDSLVAVAVDLSGRFWYVSDYRPVRDSLGDMPSDMVNHFFYSLASESRINLHFKFLSPGENEHHRVEAMFKGFGRALRQAVNRGTDGTLVREGIPSTKGTL